MKLLGMTDADRQVFDANYLLSGLPQATKDELAALTDVEECQPGRGIILEGEKSADLLVVLRGTATVMKGVEKIAEVGPGSVIGEIALVDAMPRSADVKASTPMAFARLDGLCLRRYMVEHKDAGFLMLANLARVLASRTRDLNEQVEDLKGEARDPWPVRD